jgi:hypothetical protein
MDPADARTPENLEKARKQREEAIRQQQARIAEQATQLKQQQEKGESEKRALKVTRQDQMDADVAQARMEYEEEQVSLRQEAVDHPPAESEIRADVQSREQPDSPRLGGTSSLEAASPEEPLPTFRPLIEADLSCPTCHATIPSYRRGAFYTECAKCGTIIKGGSS